MSFQSIPILDLSLARDPSTKPQFLDSLRHALLEVGFLYIQNTGIEDELIKEIIKEGVGFFDLPQEKKLEVEMKNAPSFLGLPSIHALVGSINLPVSILTIGRILETRQRNHPLPHRLARADRSIHHSPPPPPHGPAIPQPPRA
jgi:hypothetical protein